MINPLLPVVLSLVAAVGLWIAVRASQRLEWGLLVLIFFMPFERIPSIDALGVNFKINHFLGGLLVVLWLLSVAFGHRKLIANGMVVPLGLMFGAFVTSLLQAEFATRAGVVLIVTAFTIVLGLLIPQLLYKREQIRSVLLILGITTAVTLAFGLYQFLGDMIGLPIQLTGLDPGYIKDVFGFPRIQAFSHEPLYLGDFLLVPISLALALLAVPQRWFSRTTLLVFLGMSGIVFALTLSRGAFVGLFGSLVVLVVLLGKRFINPKTFVVIGSGVVVAALAVALILSAISPESQSRFVSHLTVQDFGKGESTVGRLQTWYQAVDLWQRSPLFGIGPGNFGPASLDYPAFKPERGWPIVNNEYFELLAEVGIVGLLAFLGVCGVLFWRSWQAYLIARDDPEMRAVLVGLTAAAVGILLQYNFFSTLYINQVWVSLGLLMAIQGIILRPKAQA